MIHHSQWCTNWGDVNRANLCLSFAVFVMDRSCWNLTFYHHVFHLYISLRNRDVCGQFDTQLASLHGNSVEEEKKQISLGWYSPVQLSTLLPHFYASFPPKDTINSSLTNPQGDLQLQDSLLTWEWMLAAKYDSFWESGGRMMKLWYRENK